jgi:hypothetical protein
MFAQFVAKVNLPFPDKFIWFMNEKKYTPNMWTLDEPYVQYMDFLDRQADPMDQVTSSIKLLLDISDAADIDVCDVFDIIKPMELIQLVRTRRLSPWLLLHCKKFKLYFRDVISPEQKIILENLINPSFWSDRFDDKEELVTKIKMYVSELGL